MLIPSPAMQWGNKRRPFGRAKSLLGGGLGGCFVSSGERGQLLNRGAPWGSDLVVDADRNVYPLGKGMDSAGGHSLTERSGALALRA